MKKRLKLTLIAFGLFVFLFFTVAALLPDQMSVSRSTEIQAAPSEVYKEVANLKRWQNWNPWTTRDPNIKQSWSEPDSGVGAWWRWQSEEIGNGKLTVAELTENEKMASRLEFEGMDIEIRDVWTFEQKGGAAVVTWRNESPANYPVGRYFGLFLDGMTGGDLEEGLANLKKISERRADAQI